MLRRWFRGCGAAEPSLVITIQERLGECLNPVRQRIANSLGRIRSRGGDYLTYALIDAIIDGYFPVLEQYAGQLDEPSARLEKRAAALFAPYSCRFADDSQNSESTSFGVKRRSSGHT
ncbi:hypothetical protein SH528x_002223 [Novipirellula sp. SH528]|uniref:hypothetical protein n=1 Tax=Novipirellula sp. SH528 TaxID=3454466 RepID=UPI003F9FC65C